MAKFLTSNELNAEMEKLFESAQEQLILISPFVKLHSRYESSLLTKKSDPDLKIIVVFGKNENDLSKSLNTKDLDFFKQFPNIEIRYEKRLHAKYYANENAAILSSMNLYSYSQDNNIETGILMTPPIGRALGMSFLENLDTQSFGFFQRVIEQSTLLYCKEPHFEHGLLGLTKKYTHSIIETDNMGSYDAKAKRNNQIQSPVGYCIETGKCIPFCIERPLSDTAFKNWSKKSDINHKGSYCHYSGEKGATTFSKPILRKNWKKAQEID